MHSLSLHLSAEQDAQLLKKARDGEGGSICIQEWLRGGTLSSSVEVSQLSQKPPLKLRKFLLHLACRGSDAACAPRAGRGRAACLAALPWHPGHLVHTQPFVPHQPVPAALPARRLAGGTTASCTWKMKKSGQMRVPDENANLCLERLLQIKLE